MAWSSGFTNRVKLDALTGLRIVAAAMIVAHHARGFYKLPVPNYALDHGVSFFFVLSGFILTYAYPRLDNKHEVFSFYVARVARIWPAHFTALLLAMALLQTPLDITTFVPNALLLHSWIPSKPWYYSYNHPSWSISTEWFFYLAFPLLIFQWNKSWWWKWIVSALLVIALVRLAIKLNLPPETESDEPSVQGLLYVNPLARLFEFVTGMVANLAFQKTPRPQH